MDKWSRRRRIYNVMKGDGSMSSLYELKNEYIALKEMMEDDSVDEQVILDTMEGIDYEIEIKADNYAKIIRELEGEAETIRKEISRLDDKYSRIKDNVKRLKDNLKQAMIETGKTKFKTDLFSFGIQKNGGKTPLIIDGVDINEVPEKYKEMQKIERLNTDAIREDLEKGIDVGFARFGERRESLRIK
jgi:hypothetical protein